MQGRGCVQPCVCGAAVCVVLCCVCGCAGLWPVVQQNAVTSAAEAAHMPRCFITTTFQFTNPRKIDGCRGCSLAALSAAQRLFFLLLNATDNRLKTTHLNCIRLEGSRSAGSFCLFLVGPVCERPVTEAKEAFPRFLDGHTHSLNCQKKRVVTTDPRFSSARAPPLTIAMRMRMYPVRASKRVAARAQAAAAR